MFTLAARLALGIALLGIWLSASAEPGYACSCLLPGSPTEALANADAVFRGVATSVHVGETTFQVDERRGNEIVRITVERTARVTVEFDVKTVWKGPLNQTATITTWSHRFACGFPFSQGEEYIVYAHRGSTGICGRTHNMATGFYDDDYNDLEELGPGQAPTADATPTANPTPAPTATPTPPTTTPTAAVNPPATGGCGMAPDSGADIWWAALAVGVAWLGKRGTRPR